MTKKRDGFEEFISSWLKPDEEEEVEEKKKEEERNGK